MTLHNVRAEYAEEGASGKDGQGIEISRGSTLSGIGHPPFNALWMASRIPIGRIAKTSSVLRSRTTVGFFKPSIKCRPISKLAGVTRA